jgi:fatty acid-binding protein DegV
MGKHVIDINICSQITGTHENLVSEIYKEWMEVRALDSIFYTVNFTS